MKTPFNSNPNIHTRINQRFFGRTLRILSGSVAACLTFVLVAKRADAADQFFAGDGSALATSKWGTSAAGPFTSAFTAGNVANFAIVNGTGTGGSISVSGIVATENFTLTAASGTLSTGGAVIPITVSDGKTLNLFSQSLSTAAGTGFIKNGNGTLFSSNGNQYGGGFTLNAGTMVVGGVNAMGATNTLTINGGTIAASATRDLTGKYPNGITVGNSFQLGALVADIPLSSSTANLTFSNNMGLGAATRTITIGANGTYTLGGVISGAVGTGLNVTTNVGASGILAITNAANLFTGPISITGGDVRFTSDGSFGAVPGTVTDSISLNGGTFSTATNGAFTLNSNRSILLGTNGGTISSTGASAALVYGGILKDLTTGGNFTKSGAGSLELSGANTYTGNTTISAGSLKLTGGSAIGSGNLSVKIGGTLDVTGLTGSTFSTPSNRTVSGGGTILGQGKTVTFAGTVSPGDSTPGALTFNGGTDGTLSLASTASFVFDLGSSSDQLTLTGNSTLDIGTGVLEYSDFNFTAGTGFGEGTYTLFGGASALGAGNTLGSAVTGTIPGFNATLALNGNNVVLMVVAVPEPGSAVLLVLGAVAAGLRRRHRRSSPL